MAPIEILGKTRLQMHDAEITLAADGGQIKTDQGNVSVANAAVVVSPGANEGDQMVEISGDVSSKIPALSAIMKQVQPDPLKGQKLPIDINTLDGSLNVRLVSTITVDSKMQTKNVDYTVNGKLVDFGS